MIPSSSIAHARTRLFILLWRIFKIIEGKQLKRGIIKIITFSPDLRKMCPLYQNVQKSINHPESSSSCIMDHTYNIVLLVILESLSVKYGVIPNNANNIMGTPFNLLIRFRDFRVHFKMSCHHVFAHRICWNMCGDRLLLLCFVLR